MQRLRRLQQPDDEINGGEEQRQLQVIVLRRVGVLEKLHRVVWINLYVPPRRAAGPIVCSHAHVFARLKMLNRCARVLFIGCEVILK